MLKAAKENSTVIVEAKSGMMKMVDMVLDYWW